MSERKKEGRKEGTHRRSEEGNELGGCGRGVVGTDVLWQMRVYY